MPRPEGLAVTCTVDGVLALPCVTVSQFPTLAIADTLTASGPGAPETVTLWVSAVVAPAAAVKTSGVVGAEIVPELTCKLTGITIGLPLAELEVTSTRP